MNTFRGLHHSDTPLLLPNAWDVCSALAFAAAGFAAVGTTSFGIAASAGRPDGGRASRAATLALAAQLRGLPVHLTADIEDGYADEPAAVADYAAELAELGVVGVNLEDSTAGRLVDPAVAAAKISAVAQRCPELFVNARVDNLWFGQEPTVDAVVRRALAYADAGASGIFVPGLADPEQIRAVTAAVPLPVNVLAHPTLTVTALGELGVRRVSSGSLPYRAAVDAAVAAVCGLRDGEPATAATSYWDVQNRLVDFDRG